MEFGPLEPNFSESVGYFSDKVMNFYVEDKFNPGTFIYDYYGRGLVRHTPSTDGIELFCGSYTERARQVGVFGSALDARFNLITGIYFDVGRQRLLILDFYANCIVQYDETSGNVTELFGKCTKEPPGKLNCAMIYKQEIKTR